MFMPVDEQLLISSSPQLPVIMILSFDLMNLAILDTAYKWNHAVFIFLCLAYFP